MSITRATPITANTFLSLERRWHQGRACRPLLILAALIALIATPALLMMDGIRWAYRAMRGVPSADYPYFYSTKIFDQYQKQLKEFVESEVAKNQNLSSLALVQWILNPITDKEAFHRGVVERHRALLNQRGDLDPKVAQFAERFCNWIYTGLDLLAAMTQWIKEHMTSGEKEIVSQKVDYRSIQALHSRLQKEPRFQGEVFQDYRPYDPRYLGDTPSRLFKLGDTQIIRTPAVTRDAKRGPFGHLTKAAIVEEFEGFLDHSKNMGKKHLYVNLMMRQDSEKTRIEALEELEQRRGDTLDLMTLSYDCDFYHQSNLFSALSDAKQFKEAFIHQMFSDSKAFHWPISWNRNETEATVRGVIEQVHQTHFSSASTLGKKQRHHLIELAYIGIIETFIRNKKPATCNVSCRSCVDRGAMNLSLLYAKTQPLNDCKSRETLTTIALAPALIAQGRPMLNFRMDRLSALDHLNK